MKVRIISAIILLIVFIPVLIIGKLPFSLLMLFAAMLGLHELLGLRKTKKEFPIFMELFAYILVGFLAISHHDSQSLTYTMDYRMMAFMMFAFILPMVFINNNKKYNLNDALFLIGSTLFIGLSFNLLILIRNASLTYIIYLFIISIMTDTYAYFTGKYIGRYKLAEKISPNKTIEGSIGGSLMATIMASTYYHLVIDPSLNVGIVIFVTLCLSIIGQLGDLVFSSIKRYYDRKDFSNIIPGHGGILDRLDSIIFVVLGFVLFLTLL